MAKRATGCWVEHGIVGPDVVSRLLQTCPSVPGAGLREPFVAWDGAISVIEPARSIASKTPDIPARLTRAILFDKPPGRNWNLEVHQDVTIAVAERVDAADGFGPWSRKHGCWHCEAPAEVLSRMVTVRIHMEDADEGNGCLLVAPMPAGREGKKLSRDDLLACANYLIPMQAKAGDAVIMSPLTPHASGRNTTDRHRRVLHMEFAAEQPGQGLRWRDEAEVLGTRSPSAESDHASSTP